MLRNGHFRKHRVIFCALFALLTQHSKAEASSPYKQLTKNVNINTSASDHAMDHALSTINNSKTMPGINNAKITEKSKDLEAVFLSVMLEPVFPTGDTNDLYGGGNGQGIFRSMMLQEYGKILAHNGGVGLAKSIEKQLVRQTTTE